MAFPAFVDYTTAQVTSGNAAVSVPPPTGVASGNYQLVVVSLATGGTGSDFPVVAGWTKLVDQAVTASSSTGSGSGRVAVYESTTATGTFALTLGVARVWGATRAYWSLPAGSTGRTITPTYRESAASTTHALPAIATTADDSLVIGVAASDQHSSVAPSQSWTGFGTFTERVDTGPLGNTTEMQAIGIGDLQVASATSGVTTNFTSETVDAAGLVSIVLNGVGTTATTKTGTDTASGSDVAELAIPFDGTDTAAGTDTAETGIPQDSADTGTTAETWSTEAAAAGTDAWAGVDTLAIDASLTAADGSTAHDEAQVIIPASDSNSDTDETVSLNATLGLTEPGTGSDGAAVEVLFGDLVISLYGIHPTTGALVALPDFEQLTLSPQRNNRGAISLRYPPDGLNFDLLRETVTGDRDLEVEIWTSGSDQGALRGYLQEAVGDDVAEDDRSWTFAGAFLELRLSEAVVWPQDANEKRELVFSAATPGDLVAFIMDQAQDRGTLTDIVWNFTDTADSNGHTWPKVISTKFSPGAGYDQILDRLVSLDLVEWAIVWTGTQRELKLWNPVGRGFDRTVGNRPVVMRRGRNLIDAPRKWSVRETGTAVLAIGSEGVYDDVASVDAQTRRGRRIEVAASANNLADEDAVAAFAATQLQATTIGLLEVTHGIGFLPGEPRPIVAFDVGDWVYSQVSTTLERLRVVQWTLTIDADRQPSGTVTLNDTVQNALVRLQGRLNALSAGETVVGTSEPSQQEDTGIPLAPTGIIVGSTAHLVGTEATSATTVSWSPVEFNVDGSAATDLAGYKVQHAFQAAPDDWIGVEDVGPNSTSATFGAPPQVWLSVRVAAYDQNGNTSVWSEVVTHETAAYESPPAVPSTPTATDFLGTGRIGWDGNTAAGAPMPAASPAFVHAQVHISPASMFTPSAATQVGTMRTYGTFSVVDLPYNVTQYVRLVAEDAYGNVSGPSAQASFTPQKLVNIDIGPNAIDRAQIIDGEIVTAKIANLAVNDAKIADLSVGKLTAGFVAADMIMSTGEIRTGSSATAYGVYDAAGLKFVYNGNTTIEFKAVDGSALITGTYRSGLVGERINLLPDGTQRFYGSSGSDYASIENDVGVLRMRSRADGSGRRSFVDYNPTGMKVWYGAFGAERSKFDLGLTYGVITAPVTGIRNWRQITPSDNTQNRFHFVQASGTGDDSASVIHYYGRREGWTANNSITDNTGVLRNAAHANGILMGGGSVAILGNRDDVYGPFTADGFSTPSSGLLKTEPTELVRHVPLGALSAVRGADGKAWYYLHDLEPWPEKPDLKVQRIREDGTVEMVDADWAREQPAPRLHFGPIAEDLQAVSPHLVHRDDQGQLMVDLRDLVGVLWAAVGELDRGVAARLDRLERTPEAIIIDGEDVP